MTAIIIDGKARATALRESVAAEVADFVAAHGRAPGLTVVLVGATVVFSVSVMGEVPVAVSSRLTMSPST